MSTCDRHLRPRYQRAWQHRCCNWPALAQRFEVKAQQRCCLSRRTLCGRRCCKDTNSGADQVPICVREYKTNTSYSQGNADQGGNGGSLMTSLAQQALKQCPNTKVILSGYSQGGFVVHVAAQSLSATPPLGGKFPPFPKFITSLIPAYSFSI